MDNPMFNRVWTIPNVLSVLRLGMTIPLLMALHQGRIWLGFTWAVIGILTDLSDGFIARKFDQCSDLGRILDPIIDKIVTISVVTFLVLSSQYNFPLWFYVFMMFREVVVLVFGFTIVRKKHVVLESTLPGKISAMTTSVMILLFMVKWQPVALWLVYIVFVLTVYSSVIYWMRFQAALKNVKE